MTDDVRWYGVLSDLERADLVGIVLNRASRATLGQGDWWDLLQSYARDDTMQVIAAVGDAIDPVNLNSLLANWWTYNAHAWRLGEENVVRWFRRAGVVNDGGRHVVPVETVEAWRGTRQQTEWAGRGFSWTMNRHNAYWFAEKDPVDFGTQPGAIWSALIDPDAVLGVFDNNGEKELVVDPSLLRNLCLVEIVVLQEDAILNFERCQAMRDRGDNP